MAIKDFNVQALSKYFSPQASHDLNLFLENLPQNVGKGNLISGGIAWAAVAALALFSMIQAQQITKLRGEFQATEALKPIVPVMTMMAVPDDQIMAFVERVKPLYPGLTIAATGNTITIQSKDTSAYAQYREALGYALNGGSGWKVSIKSLCVGRECTQNAIDVSLLVQKISIDKPVQQEAPSEDTKPVEETAS